VVPEKFQRRAPRQLSKANTPDLVKLLEHPNGWHRDTAARLIYERQDKTVLPKLAELTSPLRVSYTAIHALYALAGLKALTEEQVRYALWHNNGAVREIALKLAEPFLAKPSEELWTELRRLVERSDRGLPDAQCEVQLALALVATEGPRRTELLLELLKRQTPTGAAARMPISQNHPSTWIESIVLSALEDDAFEVFADIATGKRRTEYSQRLPLLGTLARAIGARNDSNQIAGVLAFAASDNAGTGRDWRMTRDPILTSEVVTALDDGLRRSGATLHTPATEASLRRIYDSIRPVALGHSRDFSEQARATTIRALATAPYKDVKPDLLSLLFIGTNSPAIQTVTVDALGRFPAQSLGDDLLQMWSFLTPSVRTDVVSVLLKRPERIRALLDALAKGTLQAADLSVAQQAQLRSHRDAAIRERAAIVLGRAATAPRQSVVDAFQPAMKLKGDATSGRKIFQARCASCHKLGAEGHTLGPDLATVKGGGREKLLIAILDPNREVAPNFASYTVETKDGESLLGVLASESAGSVTLRMAGGAESVIARANITSLQGQGRSLMPEGLEEGLKPQDMADLLEFILGP
jgi:putative heme-binding domain-containing protein